MTQEAYALVRRIGFSYSDVKSMTSLERRAFLDMAIEEAEKEADAMNEKMKPPSPER